MSEIETTDIYEGAYLMLSGHHLCALEKDRRKRIRFRFSGENVAGSLEEFQSGRAVGNIAMYLFTLEKLKDRLFGVLRGGGK